MRRDRARDPDFESQWARGVIGPEITDAELESLLRRWLRLKADLKELEPYLEPSVEPMTAFVVEKD